MISREIEQIVEFISTLYGDGATAEVARLVKVAYDDGNYNDRDFWLVIGGAIVVLRGSPDQFDGLPP